MMNKGILLGVSRGGFLRLRSSFKEKEGEKKRMGRGVIKTLMKKGD